METLSINKRLCAFIIIFSVDIAQSVMLLGAITYNVPNNIKSINGSVSVLIVENILVVNIGIFGTDLLLDYKIINMCTVDLAGAVRIIRTNTYIARVVTGSENNGIAIPLGIGRKRGLTLGQFQLTGCILNSSGTATGLTETNRSNACSVGGESNPSASVLEPARYLYL